MVRRLISSIMAIIESSQAKTVVTLGHILPRQTLDGEHEVGQLQRTVLDILRRNLLLCSSHAAFTCSGVAGRLRIESGYLCISPAGICLFSIDDFSYPVAIIPYWQIADLECCDQQLAVEYFALPESKTTERLVLRTFLAEALLADAADCMLANMRANRLLYYCHQDRLQGLPATLGKRQVHQSEGHRLLLAFQGLQVSEKDRLRIAEFESKKRNQAHNWFFQKEFQATFTDQLADCNTHRSFAFIVEKNTERQNDQEDHLWPDEVASDDRSHPESVASLVIDPRANRLSDHRIQVLGAVDSDLPQPDLGSRRSSRRLSRTELLNFAPQYSSKPKTGGRRSVRAEDLHPLAEGKEDFHTLIGKSDARAAFASNDRPQASDPQTHAAIVGVALAQAGLDGKPAKEVMTSSILAALRRLPPKKAPN